MLGLKSPAKRRLSNAQDEPDHEKEKAASFSRSIISPRRTYPIGRQISFSIAENSIQLAAASKRPLRIKFLDVRTVYIPSSLTSADERLGFTTETVRDYVREFGGRWPTISVTISGTETASRLLSLPWLSKKELASAIQFEARKQIPFPIDDSVFDYRPTEKIVDGDHKLVKVSVVAATRRLISAALEPFDQLGLEVTHIFHSADVVGQLLPALPGFREGYTYCLINVRQRSTEIAYYRGAQLVFFHISAIGSSLLTDRADQTTFDYFSESLASEIRKSLDYYTGQFPTQFANQVLIYGDLSYAEELIGLLSDRFGFSFQRIPAEYLSFIRGRNLDFEDSLSVCLPVLASSACSTDLPNLSPKERQLSRRIRRLDRVAFVSLATLLVLLCIGWLVQASQLRGTKSELLRISRQLEIAKNSSEFRIYTMLKHQIAVDQSYVDKTKETPSYLGLNLKELSRLTPAPIRLYYLQYDAAQPDRDFSIFGVVTDSEIPPEIVLAEYVESLRSSPFYDDVVVNRHTKRWFGRQPELDFQISARGII